VKLDGRGFIVTGGTGNLGQAVVQALLAAGARVAVPYRSEDPWRELHSVVGSTAALWGCRADVADAEDARRFFDSAVSWLEQLDGVAALAGGYAGSGTLEVTSPGEWTDMMRINLETAHATCRAALPHLLARGGSVVTVSSRLAETGGPGAAAYAVSKAGVMALTRALALENKDRGVRFNCVVPGIIDTPPNRAAMPSADVSRWTPPAEIARVVVFLLAPESSPVTGGVIPVHGRG
jgi:NAD(P)-dependent dehydrogenase (short-subunit alcohol dehydrogenase family)